MGRKIAIVGGGYVGADLARSLERAAEVTLIEPRSHFVHTPAMIRAAVKPEILDRALIPYDKLLREGRLLRARAGSVDREGVTLQGGERIAADLVVVATGSEYAAPFKARGADIEVFRAENARIHDLLMRARSVAIVGAGAVGVELAGEIAHFLPEKRVTLITDQPRLFPDKPARLGDLLRRRLEAARVTLFTGGRAESLKSRSEPHPGPLTLSTGETVEADLVFPATGSRAVSGLLAPLPGAEETRAGRIRVDRFLRPSRIPNLFAAGDAADTGDAMTIVAIARQLPWLKKTLAALAGGKTLEELPPYTPWSRAPIIVPVGPSRGASFLTFLTAGDLITSRMKGRGMFIGKYRKMLRAN